MTEPGCDLTVEQAEGAGLATMRCKRCGAARVLDPALPFVNQTASFISDHDCPARPPSV